MKSVPRLIVAFLLIVSSAFSAEPTFPPHDLQCDDDLVVELVLSDPTIAQPMEVQFDERNRLWVVEYRQYPEPAGITQVDRDEYWRVRYDRMPPPPPHAVGSPFRGQDRITIHTDTNGDGQYDEHKTFVDGLSLTTSVAFAADGLFVLTPPYLVFYPDADKDDVPDGDPVVHLSGFGIEDTHSIANSLTWGPDGWLYGCNGSTCTMSITSPFWEDDAEPIARSGQNIWRYHPPTHRFEVFAEGGGNSFGLEIDAAGDVFSGHNGGNTRGFHFIKGGYYRKNFGKHGDFSNPYTFGHFEGMEHHTVERFSHHFVIYDAVALPQRFHHQLIGIDVLHRNLVLSDIQPHGSTFKTKDLSRPVWSDGDVFSPVDMCIGHDGCLYVADWADKTVSHLLNREGQMEPETGRVFRLRPKTGDRYQHPSFANKDLVERLTSSNRIVRQTALRLVRERASDGDRKSGSFSPSEVDAIAAALRDRVRAGEPYALDALWGLNALNVLNDDDVEQGLRHGDPSLRRWAVRFADEDDDVYAANKNRERFAAMAASEPDVRVATEILAAIRDWPYGNSDTVLEAFTQRTEFLSDTFFPLMLWWAVEATRPADSLEIVERLQMSNLSKMPIYRDTLQERLARTLAFDRTGLGWDALAVMLQNCESASERATVFDALEASLAGGRAPGLSLLLDDALETYRDELSLKLRLRLNVEGAVSEFIAILPKANAKVRRELLSVIAETQPIEARDPLLRTVLDPDTNASTRLPMIATLAAYSSQEIGSALISAFDQFESSEQAAVIELLTSRPAWSTQLMDAVDGGMIEAKRVSPLLVNQIRMHGDAAVVARAERMWPAASVGKTDIAKELHRWTRRVTVGHRGNADRGAALYKTHCAGCHKLFDQGQNVGPDLTGYQRSNRQLMLLALIAPSAEIREGYETATLILNDGSVLTGIIGRQNDTSVELKDAKGNVRTIARDTIDTLQVTPVSLMPTGLLEKLTDQQTRDLFAYLQTAKQ